MFQIKIFWKQLAWPDVEGSYTFVAKIIDVSTKLRAVTLQWAEHATKMVKQEIFISVSSEATMWKFKIMLK